ncbi:MAG: acyl-CoA dehydrogenase family protein [Gammaproteobacteria bacterium]|nr:acyl-CoA dehydrogenase family protein [Gammaproteobacteria bacterium]
MALVLNEEQRMLKDAARDFLSEHAPVAQLRQLRDSRDAQGYSRATWQQMVDLGWSGVLVPEAQGGLDFGHVGMGQIMEQNGRTLTASPLFATAVMGVSALVQAGSLAQRNALLPAIVAGELQLAPALDEGPHHAPCRVRTRLEARGDGFVLNGEKQFVPDGHSADQLIVSARSAGADADRDGISLVLVERTAPGVTVERVVMADSRNSAMIRFDNVALPRAALLGEPGTASAVIERLTEIGNAHLAAELLGLSLEACEQTVAYLNTRKQFGVLIGSYQGLQHRAAHQFSEIELLKSLVIKTLQALDAGSAEVAVLASLAKAKAGEVATLATNEAVQLHGGVGMTDELDIGFFMKRARVAEHLYGDHRYHLRRFAALSGY